MSAFRYTPHTVSTIRLHAQTMAPAEIAEVMRCSIGTVELICRKHGIEMRSQDYVLPPPPTREERKITTTEVEIRIHGVSFTIIAQEARRRGMATRDLIARIVDEVAQEQLFGAVLDQ